MEQEHEREEKGRQDPGGRGETGAVGRESEDQSRQAGPRGRPGVDFSPGRDSNTGVDQDPDASQRLDQQRASRSAGSYEVGAGQQERGAPSSLQTYLQGVTYPIHKQDLLRHLHGGHAPQAVLDALQHAPDQEFHSPRDVDRAVRAR
jgi:hypothetical protein